MFTWIADNALPLAIGGAIGSVATVVASKLLGDDTPTRKAKPAAKAKKAAPKKPAAKK